MPPVKRKYTCALSKNFGWELQGIFFLNERLEAIILYLAVLKAGMQDHYIFGSATYSTE